MNTAGQRRALGGRSGSGSTLEAVVGVFAVRDWTKFTNWRRVMRKRMRGRLVPAIIAAGLVGGLALGTPPALADPELPPPPPAPIDPAAAPAPPPDPFAPPPPADPLAVPPPVDPAAPPPAAPFGLPNPFAPPPPAAQPAVIPEGTPAGQNPTPYVGEPVFAPPTFNPLNGSMVGVAKPIIINFQRPIADRPMAEQAIHISSIPPVPGKFYWMNDSQVRWRPI